MSDNPLELIRKKRKLTEYAMAKLIGCSQSSYVFLIESERTSFKRLKAIAEKLNLTDKELRDLIEKWEPVAKDKPKSKNNLLTKISD